MHFGLSFRSYSLEFGLGPRRRWFRSLLRSLRIRRGRLEWLGYHLDRGRLLVSVGVGFFERGRVRTFWTVVDRCVCSGKQLLEGVGLVGRRIKRVGIAWVAFLGPLGKCRWFCYLLVLYLRIWSLLTLFSLCVAVKRALWCGHYFVGRGVIRIRGVLVGNICFLYRLGGSFGRCLPVLVTVGLGGRSFGVCSL